jgi:hypothetical protein
MRMRWVAIGAVLLAAGAALAMALLSRPESALGGGPVGTAVAVDPAATIAAVTAQLASPVRPQDLIETGPDGAIRVRFVDATFFSLGANASVRIDKYVFDPARDASSMSLDFTRGAFRFVSGKPLHTDSGQVPVRTPVAVIGIRGTAFTGVIGPDAETLWRSLDPGYRPDGGDVGEATLILLGAGAIDVDGSGVRTPLDIPGQALFFRRRGAPPLGPLMVRPQSHVRIEALGSPPNLGPEPGASPPPRSPSAGGLPATPPGPAPGPTAARPRPPPTASPEVPSPRPTPAVRSTPRPTPSPYVPPTQRPTATPSSRPTFRPPVARPTSTPSPRPTLRPPVTRPIATPSPRPTFRPPVTRATAPPRPPIRVRPRPTPTQTPGTPAIR